MEYFTSSDDNHYSDFLYLKAESIYLVSKEGAMLWYPYLQHNIPLFDFRNRPWATAVWETGDEQYHSDFVNGESGLTALYVDIDKKDQPIGIRTLWYKFKKGETDYVLCLDLLFDSNALFDSNVLPDSNNLISNKSNLFIQYVNSGLVVTLAEKIWLNFLIQSSILTLLMFLLCGFIYRRFVYKSDDLVKIKLKRNERRYTTKDEDNKIEFTVQGETTEVNESKQSREAKWHLDIHPVGFNLFRALNNIIQNKSTYKYEFTETYPLGLSKSNFRCIETWNIFLETQSGHKENIGSLVAKWNKTNSANTLDELEVNFVYLEKKYEETFNLISIKERLCDHLLISEEAELVLVLDPNKESESLLVLDPSYKEREDIPHDLDTVDIIRETLDKSLYLKQRKIVFPEIETIAKIYSIGTVKAICSLNFLKLLINRGKLRDFFDVPVRERYIIENTEAEFRGFYENLNDDDKLNLRSIASLKIIGYQEGVNNFTGPQDDFCIIEINNKPSIVAYTFTDERYSTASWISWRKVDVNFYDELYKSQADKRHGAETVDNYLNKISL